MKELKNLPTFEQFINESFGHYIFGYDLANGNFINQKMIDNLDKVDDLEIVVIEVDEPNAYNYKWKLKYKGDTIINDGGSIQAFVKNIGDLVVRINGKKLSHKEESKLFSMHKYFGTNESIEENDNRYL